LGCCPAHCILECITLLHICLYLFTVFVVAHVGQEGPNCAKGNNKVQKALYILSKKHLQCENY
jgi:hypothetical protein